MSTNYSEQRVNLYMDNIYNINPLLPFLEPSGVQNIVLNLEENISNVCENKQEKVEEEKISLSKRQTEPQSHIVKIEEEKQRENPFEIIKNNKIRGRLPKCKKKIIKGNHTNIKEDNIFRKFKAHLINSIYNYINSVYEKYMGKNKGHFLQKINPKQSQSIKRDDNLKWFDTKLREVFSVELCGKCKNDKDYNKKQINKLYEENTLPELKNLLEKTISYMYEIFISNQRIEGFSNLDDDLNSLRKIMENDGESDKDINDYLQSYEETVRGFVKIFSQKKSRGERKKKKTQ